MQFRPHGSSMKGKVESGELVTVVPVAAGDVRVGDIVLCKVKGHIYLHLVKSISAGRFLIGNNRGGINGWTTKVYGKVIPRLANR